VKRVGIVLVKVVAIFLILQENYQKPCKNKEKERNKPFGLALRQVYHSVLSSGVEPGPCVFFR